MVGVSELKKMSIPLPPLNEQLRIVNKVKNLNEICDELEKEIMQSKLDSKRLKKTFLQESFTTKEVVFN